MSKIADDTYGVLRELFPQNIIIKEHFVFYKGTRLFFDFFIKDLSILIECQGRQHLKFIKHFHGTAEAFKGQKKRDNLKVQYIQENPKYCLVLLYDQEDKITKELVLKRILEAQGA